MWQIALAHPVSYLYLSQRFANSKLTLETPSQLYFWFFKHSSSYNFFCPTFNISIHVNLIPVLETPIWRQMISNQFFFFNSLICPPFQGLSIFISEWRIQIWSMACSIIHKKISCTYTSSWCNKMQLQMVMVNFHGLQAPMCDIPINQSIKPL